MRKSSALTLAFFIFALAPALQPSSVAACEFALPNPLQIVADPSDQRPPSSPLVSLVKVKRGDEWNEGGGCGSASSCDGSAFIRLQVAANDDTTPTSELGYVIESTETRLDVSQAPVLSDASGQITILFKGSDDGSDDVRFHLQVFAVDKAGNISTQPTPLTVSDDGKACQIASKTPAGSLWCIALVLALVARQRRRMHRRAARGG
jgi:hypothetical protein